MASPFANAGLGNFGNESKYYSEPTEMPGILQGLKATGIVALKNMLGVPTPGGAAVAPITPVAPVAPIASVGVSPATASMQPTANDLLHPELNAASQTNPYGK